MHEGEPAEFTLNSWELYDVYKGFESVYFDPEGNAELAARAQQVRTTLAAYEQQDGGLPRRQRFSLEDAAVVTIALHYRIQGLLPPFSSLGCQDENKIPHGYKSTVKEILATIQKLEPFARSRV